jgi:hypothetical protein
VGIMPEVDPKIHVKIVARDSSEDSFRDSRHGLIPRKVYYEIARPNSQSKTGRHAHSG